MKQETPNPLSLSPIIDDKLYPPKQYKVYVPVSDVTWWRWEKKGLVTFVRIGAIKFLTGKSLKKLVAEGAE